MFFRRNQDVNWADSRTGATAIEYGLIAALIAIVIIGTVTAIGTGVRDSPEVVSDAIEQQE